MKDPELQRDVRRGAVKNITIYVVTTQDPERKLNANDWQHFDLAPAYSNIKLAEIIVEALAQQGYPVRLEVLKEQTEVYNTVHEVTSVTERDAP